MREVRAVRCFDFCLARVSQIYSDSPTQLKPFSFLHFLEQPSPSSKSPSSHSSSRLLKGQHPDVLTPPLTRTPWVLLPHNK